MRKPIGNVVRIRGFHVQPIESLSFTQRAVILYALFLRAVQDAGVDRLMRYNDPGGGGGGLRFGSDVGVPLKPPTLYPSFWRKRYPLLLCSS